MSSPVLAHLSPAEQWAVLSVLVLLAGAYLIGVRTAAPRPRALVAFGVAVAGSAVSLLWPIGDLADERFSWHMVQHLLLVGVVAPAIVLAEVPRTVLGAWPRARARWHRGVPAGALRRIVRLHLSSIVLVAGASYVVVLWAWHLPRAYDRAIEEPVVHVVEHLTMVGAALAVWAAVAYAHRQRAGAVIGALFACSMAGGLLGSLIVFREAPLYRSYIPSQGPHAALEDQQLAGLLMWVPGGMLFVAAVVVVVLGLLPRLERRRRLLDRATFRTVSPGVGG